MATSSSKDSKIRRFGDLDGIPNRFTIRFVLDEPSDVVCPCGWRVDWDHSHGSDMKVKLRFHFTHCPASHKIG